MTTPVIRRHYPCQLQLQHWGSLGPHLVAPISSHLRHIDKQFVFRHRCDQFSIIHRAQIRKILQNTTMPTWGPRIEWYFSLLVGAWWETLAGWVGGWYLVTRSRLHTLHSAHQISLIVTFYYSAYVSLRSGGMIKPNNIIYPSWITSWTGCLRWSSAEENLPTFQEAESFGKFSASIPESAIPNSKLIVMQKNCSQSAFSI